MEEDSILPFEKSQENIKVFIRLRGLNEKEVKKGAQSCITVHDDSVVSLGSGMDAKHFTFDWVAPENITQEEIFLKSGKEVTDWFLQGYFLTSNSD